MQIVTFKNTLIQLFTGVKFTTSPTSSVIIFILLMWVYKKWIQRPHFT